MPGPVQSNGMSSAAAALQMLERRQAVLANNLANASTRGFKAEVALAPDGDNRLKGTARYASDPSLVAVAQVTIAGKKAEQARFTPLAAKPAADAHKH